MPREKNEVSTWDENQAEKYAAVKHGPDGAVFIDPQLAIMMSRERLEGAAFADLGAGAGPWTEYALQQGVNSAKAIDINPAMLEQAKKRLDPNSEGLPSNVELQEGDVADLPYGDKSFDFLLSSLTGCNLPSGTFEKSFAEAYRTAKPGASFVVTAPNSLAVPFTGNGAPDDIQKAVDELWTAHKGEAKKVLSGLRGILRATFILDHRGKPILITEDNAECVNPGDPILRVIPGLVVDNNWHIEREYIAAAEKAGWTIRAKVANSFRSEAERKEHNDSVDDNQKLGPQYVNNPPFLALDLEKPAYGYL